MKKLIFLQGSGINKEDYGDLPQVVAKQFSADLVSFDAPFTHPKKKDKFTWFNKIEQYGRRDAVEKEYTYSLQYIKDQINELISEGVKPQDLIIFGHSMGGGMAVHVGLEMELGGVISVVADMPYNLQYKTSSHTPIYWFESAKDTYIDDNRKQSYNLLGKNPNFHYAKLPNSTHCEFRDDLLMALKDISFHKQPQQQFKKERE